MQLNDSMINAMARDGPEDAAKVLHLGPQAPLTGGMATVVESLLSGKVGKSIEMAGLNTGKTTRENRTLAEGLWAQFALLIRIARELRRRQVQIVHLHTCEYMGFWRDCVHASLCRWMRRKVVWHIHGGGFCQWVAQMHPAARSAVRQALERSSAVIALSEKGMHELRQFAPRANYHVVPNGVVMPEQLEAPGKPITFLFLGNWTQRKGVLDLVESVKIAKKRFACSMVVELAGFEKDPGEREKLERLISESGMDEHVRILGLIGGRRKTQALKRASCVVLPSYSENLPMAVLEGMAYGRAIIATRVGAVPEVVRDGIEGLLMEPGDVETLANHLVRIAREPELAERMGQAARIRVEQAYSVDAMRCRVGEVYRSLLKTEGEN